jgi:hypothetical protein
MSVFNSGSDVMNISVDFCFEVDIQPDDQLNTLRNVSINSSKSVIEIKNIFFYCNPHINKKKFWVLQWIFRMKGQMVPWESSSEVAVTIK